ncbi:calmodulin [Acrasis kona]|uniref:Calmodulin n=1 Tax=Acrasis kona TaxID=1008807 RepID=A0AAW2YUU5_9EUKA
MSNKLNGRKQLSEFKESFSLMLKTKKSTIVTAEDIKVVFNSLQLYPDKEQLDEIIEQVSTNSQNKGFDLVEFVSFMATAMDTLDQQEEVDDLIVGPSEKNNFISLVGIRDQKWRRMFQLFSDPEKNAITKKSIREAADTIGDEITDDDIEDMFGDVSENGLLYEEFADYMMSTTRGVFV